MNPKILIASIFIILLYVYFSKKEVKKSLVTATINQPILNVSGKLLLSDTSGNISTLGVDDLNKELINQTLAPAINELESKLESKINTINNTLSTRIDTLLKRSFVFQRIAVKGNGDTSTGVDSGWIPTLQGFFFEDYDVQEFGNVTKTGIFFYLKDNVWMIKHAAPAQDLKGTILTITIIWINRILVEGTNEQLAL
jgi:hypothetical protein